jgi:U3 small nucleolar RNA-associated protein 25
VCRRSYFSLTPPSLIIAQVFHRFSCDRPAEQSATRLAFFLEEILPKFGDVLHNRTMIFIPSYFDFVRVRNHFRTEKMSFSQICEYTPSPHVVRARSHFYHAQRHYLLYTERFHYHHRSKIRGLRHVIFYGLPHFAGFYSELLNMMESDTDVSCTILYHKFDAVRLEQVVGSARVQDMLSSQKATHLYM